MYAGFSYDGYMMYFSRSGAYKPSYQLVAERAGQNCVYNESNIVPIEETITFDNVPGTPLSHMGSHAPVPRTVQNYSVYFQGMCPEPSALLL